MGDLAIPLAPARPGSVQPVAQTLDLLAKAVLAVLLVRLAFDPAWGNLEGKAPLVRAVTYPLLGLVVPVLYLWRRWPVFPWRADLLLTLPGFSDILGNRLDLYDRVWWFDDAIHFLCTGLIAAAVLLISTDGAAVRPLVERAVAVGLTVSLWWEVWEYFAFVTRSREAGTAYGDTLGDLVLGWAGATAAGVAVGWSRLRDARRQPETS